MAHINKPAKKLEKLKCVLQQLDEVRNTIIKVIEQGGDVAVEWENTGISEVPSNGCWREMQSNGVQTYTFIIPPHDTCK